MHWLCGVIVTASLLCSSWSTRSPKNEAAGKEVRKEKQVTTYVTPLSTKVDKKIKIINYYIIIIENDNNNNIDCNLLIIKLNIFILIIKK